MEQIDRLFDELVRRRWGTETRIAPSRVREVADGWEIEIPVPDMAPEDLLVEVHGKELTVRGAKRSKRSRQLGSYGYARSARDVTFLRSFRLPEAVPAEAVEARLEDGCLRIHIRRS